MWHQRLLTLLTFGLCSYFVMCQNAEPIQVAYSQKGRESVCYCSVSGAITQIGMVYRPCDENDLIQGKNLVNLTEGTQEIAVYSPKIGMYSNVCDTVHVEQELIGGMVKVGLYCEWSGRPVRSRVGCACATFPFGVAETKWEEECENESMGNVNLTLGVGDENLTENALPVIVAVNEEALITAAPFVVGSRTDTTAGIAERLSKKSILSATVTSDLPFEPPKPTQNVEILFTVASSKTAVDSFDQKTSPTQMQKIVIGQNTTPSIAKTKKSDVTITPSTVITEIDEIEITGDKFVNSLNATKNKLRVREPNSDNENNLLSNVQSIKGKIETLVKGVVCSDPSNSDLTMVATKLKKEVVNEIAESTANVTKKLCPFNATEAVKTLKKLKEEYDSLKFVLTQGLSYAMTVFVTVLLTLGGLAALIVFLCVWLPSILKKGQNGLTKFMLIQPAGFVSVSSRDQETESELDESIV